MSFARGIWHGSLHERHFRASKCRLREESSWVAYGNDIWAAVLRNGLTVVSQQTGDGGTGGLHVAFCSGEQFRQSGWAGCDAERRDDAGFVERGGDVRIARHFSSDGDNRFSLRFRQSRDAARYLAVRRLPVD